MKPLVTVSEVVLGFTVASWYTSFSGCHQTHHTQLSVSSGEQNKMTKKKIHLQSIETLELQPLGLKTKCLNFLCHSSSQFRKYKWQLITGTSAICFRYADPEKVLLVMLKAVPTGLQRNAKSDIGGLLNILSQVLRWCKLTQPHGNK